MDDKKLTPDDIRKQNEEYRKAKQRKEDDDEIVRSIQHIYIKASELSALWDHTGTNMIEGYPKCLPSWDEFVAELGAWYEAQQKLRWHDGR